jgi:hypothetical protein
MSPNYQNKVFYILKQGHLIMQGKIQKNKIFKKKKIINYFFY